MGDFDGDGIPDLVTANIRSPYFSVLFGNGDGTFAPEVRVPTSFNKFDILVADLDGDEADDVVLSGFDATISVFMGNGDGTFADEAVYYSLVFGWPEASVASGDFDGDGHVDLIAGGGPPVLLTGMGGGAFAEPVQLQDGLARCRIIVGDFNQDTSLDYIGADFCHRGGVGLWLGRGDGTFDPRQNLPIIAGDIVAHDFNSDGRLDVVGVDEVQVTVLLATGMGLFASPVTYSLVSGNSPRIALADLDGNGDQDLVVSASEATDASVLLSNGDGSFAPATPWTLAGLGGAAVSADFNQNGRIDVAFASYFGSGPTPKAAPTPNPSIVFVMAGNGDGGFLDARPDRFDVGLAPEAVVSADFDADGHQDLAVANSESNDVSVLMGAGDGSFIEVGRAPVGTTPISLVVGTFDPGTTVDLAVANENSLDISILLGGGDGTFMPAGVIELGAAPEAITVADFDTDGSYDLATVNPATDEVHVVFGAGDATFTEPIVLDVGDEPVALVAARVDAQGGTDIIVANRASDDISVLRSNGDRTFMLQETYAIGTTDILALAAEDLNSDGFVDVVLGGFGVPSVMFLAGDGNGGFSAPLVLDTGPSVYEIGIGDFDGNGLPDIATTHTTPSVSVFLGQDEGFDPRRGYLSNRQGRVAVGEFDGDGRVDLAVAGHTVDNVAVLANQSPRFLEFGGTKTLITWPLLLGYEQFNLYRGELDDLHDADADGLPDPGYGQCWNKFDADLTDNSFADDSVPQPGRGFFYLMERVRNGVVSELGETSHGQARQPSVPCTSSFSPRVRGSQREVVGL